MHSLRTRFIIFFGLFIIISCTVLGLISVVSIMNTGIVLSEEQGYPVAKKALSAIDGDKFEQFLKNPSEDNPFYEETRLALLDIKTTVNCEYLYTMTQVEGTNFMYIIDGSCDPSDEENFSPLGTVEDIKYYGPAPLASNKDGEIHSSGLVNQPDWGWVISTYVGIKNSRGKVVGIIGIDFNVDSIFSMLNGRVVLIAIITNIFLFLGLFLVIRFTGSIFGTMKTISSAMEEIASGNADLTFRIPEKGKNELATLAKNCNGVINSLHLLVEQLKDESGVLNEAGNQLASKMGNHVEVLNNSAEHVSEIADGITNQRKLVENIAGGMQSVESEIQNLDIRLSQQSAAIQEASSAVEQITQNIKSVDKNVSIIISAYGELVKEAELGQNQQSAVSSQIEAIAQQSEHLVAANSAISSISKQTNLLAMNAAIEAAHAGEAGKGFAVVAGEIRTLAETSAKQSDSISSLLSNISSSIEGIVSSSDQTSKMFAAVGDKINQLERLIKEVQNGMNEESRGAENIIETMHTLDGTTKDITSASTQMRTESGNVFEGIKNLKDLATNTYQKSATVTFNMSDMKNTANAALTASEQSLEASNKVYEMINGFTTKK
ncbi:MAG: HAMP domain-containing protein [Treponema sp.]|nr:HAMP domain-containing protein [Treponema sp.]